MITVQMQGYEKVLESLKKYPKRKDKAVQLALEKGARNIQNTARRYVVAQTVRSKNLHKQIKAAKIKAGWRVAVLADYAPYVEFGTGNLVKVPKGVEEYALLFKGKGIKKVNLRPRPFMFPAYKRNKPILRKVIKEIFRKK